jgi:cell division protein FtsL
LLAWFTAQEPTSGFQWAEVLSSASPAFMLAIFIIALSTRRLVLPRELDELRTERDKRILQLEVERDEYKQMVFRALNVGERVVSVAESRDRT